MIKLLFATTICVLLGSTSAEAFCRHGQIRRVSMGRCVGIHSRLAREVELYHPRSYRHHPVHLAAAPRCDPQSMCNDPIEDRVTDDEPELNLPWPSSLMNYSPRP